MFKSVLLNSFFFFTFVNLVLFYLVFFYHFWFHLSTFSMFFYYIMPSTICLGCEEQKRMKDDKFYFVYSIPNPLLAINNLRQIYNTKK